MHALYLLFCVIIVATVYSIPVDSAIDDDASSAAVHTVAQRSLNVTHKAFDPEEQLPNVYYAWSAFCHQEDLIQWECEWCKKNPDTICLGVVFDNLTQAYGYVAYNNNSVIVAFRGSDNVPNDIADITFIKVKDVPDAPDAKVHLGFYTAYQRVRDRVRSLVRQALHDNPNIESVTCTGHSLGAALSGVAALDIGVMVHESNLKVAVGMTNFGMPRVGNKAFVEAFNKFVTGPVWRLTHADDVVPHLPLEAMGFHHVPTEVWNHGVAGEKQTYNVCDGSGEDKNCADSVLPFHLKPSDHMTYMGIAQDNCHT